MRGALTALAVLVAAVAAAAQTLPLGSFSPHALAPEQRFVQFQIGGSNVKAILLDGDIVWIGTSGGLIRYDSVHRRQITYTNRSGLLSNGVFHLARAGREIWVGTYGGGLSVFDPEAGQFRNYNIPSGLADAFVYDSIVTRSGDVWIATWSGANRIAGGRLDDIEAWDLFTVENTEGGLPNDWVYGLAEAPDGALWLATEGGLARFADGRWQNWSHADGLGADYERVKDDITFLNDPGRFSSHHALQKEEQGLGQVAVAYNPNYIVALAVDPAGRIWAGTWGAGLSRFDGETWVTYTVAEGLPSNHVFALERDPEGRIWAGTSRGLVRIEDDGRFTVFNRLDGLASEVVFSLAFAPSGALWVGGLGAVTLFPEGLAKAHGAR